MKTNVKAFAKINLILDITGKRDDGYHLLRTVMQSIDLFDSISINVDSDFEGAIELSCTDGDLPTDSGNIAWKAAEAFFSFTGVKNPGTKIKIKKRIPTKAGLAGGSADAAAVILALNALCETRLSEDELIEIASQVGSDVPFCLEGGTMLAEGTGTILSPLPNIPECYILIAKPQKGVSTKEAYNEFDKMSDLQHPDVDRMVEAICSHELEAIAYNAKNIFEQIESIKENTDEIKEVMKEYGAIGCCMTGSGSAVFGIFDNRSDCDRCSNKLDDFTETFICEPNECGCELEE